MSNWKSKISNLVEEIDGFSDNLRTRLRRIGDFDEDLTIVPYQENKKSRRRHGKSAKRKFKNN